MNNEDRRKYGEVLKGVVQELSRTMECVSSCLIDLKYGSVWNNTILCAENHARAAATLLERLDDLAMGQTVPVEPPDKKATYDSGRTLAHEQVVVPVFCEHALLHLSVRLIRRPLARALPLNTNEPPRPRTRRFFPAVVLGAPLWTLLSAG